MWTGFWWEFIIMIWVLPWRWLHDDSHCLAISLVLWLWFQICWHQMMTSVKAWLLYYCPFVKGIHWWPVDSSLLWVWIFCGTNSSVSGDWRCHDNHVTSLYWDFIMTSSNGNIFRITGPLCGKFTGHRWIPLTKASDAELWCFLWSAPE